MTEHRQRGLSVGQRDIAVIGVGEAPAQLEILVFGGAVPASPDAQRGTARGPFTGLDQVTGDIGRTQPTRLYPRELGQRWLGEQLLAGGVFVAQAGRVGIDLDRVVGLGEPPRIAANSANNDPTW